MVSAEDALQRLIEGNRRFVTGDTSMESLANPSRRKAIVEKQEPFAIVLGCSDSRVPAELVFDQGLGDLFMIRVAGNIVAPSQIGSVEFSAEHHGVKLVVVLGHTNCGAVAATLEQIDMPAGPAGNLQSIVDRIKPSLVPLCESNRDEDPEKLMKLAVRANVRASVADLRSGSSVIESLVKDNDLVIVGAEYSLETGVVEFFEGVPDEW